MAINQLGDGNADGVQLPNTKAGFFGVDPIARPTSATQSALTLVTATSSGFGFATSAAFNAFSAQLENIRANLVLLGLLTGS
jgi:hypothetical protein